MRIANTIADLRQQIHDDLRRQNPEWVLPNGEAPKCDAYEALLIELVAPAPAESQRNQRSRLTTRLSLRKQRSDMYIHFAS